MTDKVSEREEDDENAVIAELLDAINVQNVEAIEQWLNKWMSLPNGDSWNGKVTVV